MVTYATSSTFGAIIRDLNVPIVLVALQPREAMDYSRASTYMQLCNDDFCSVPEFTGVAIRMGKRPPPVILGTLENDPQADAELAEWCDIAKVLHDLHGARIGHFGHVLESMLDMHTDPTALTAAFGCHVVQTEADDLLRAYRAVTPPEVEAKKEQILDDVRHAGSEVATPSPASSRPRTSTMAARVAVALDKFVDEKQLDGLAYYYEAEPDSELRQRGDEPGRGQLAAHGGRLPHVRRVGPQDVRGHVHRGPPGYRRQLRRVPSDRLPRGVRARGARRPAPHQHRRRQARAPQPD